MKSVQTVVIAVALWCVPVAGFAAEAAVAVGFISSFSGDVLLVSPGSSISAEPKMRFHQGDTIRTGKDSSAGLIFQDDTLVSLGANSELVVEDFLFDPANHELSFIARLVQGSFSFVTGQIGKLAPKRVKLQTPNATLGVRGTKFLVKVD